MTVFIFIFGFVLFVLGVLVGRIYGWMKYHYPEFQEEIRLRVARTKAERMRYEVEVDRARGEIDDELDRRIGSER